MCRAALIIIQLADHVDCCHLLHRVPQACPRRPPHNDNVILHRHGATVPESRVGGEGLSRMVDTCDRDGGAGVGHGTLEAMSGEQGRTVTIVTLS